MGQTDRNNLRIGVGGGGFVGRIDRQIHRLNRQITKAAKELGAGRQIKYDMQDRQRIRPCEN